MATLTLAEELLLLLHDDESGEQRHLPEENRRYALAGAVLMDLALAGRIDSDPQSLTLVDATPMEDDILDPCLSQIASSAEEAGTVYWLDRFASPAAADPIRERALDRLDRSGILTRSESGLLSLSGRVARAGKYTLADGTTRRDVKLRVMGVLFADDIPDSRDTMLITLAEACGIFHYLLKPSELDEVQERIDLICRFEEFGRSVFEAIRRNRRVADEFVHGVARRFAPSAASREPPFADAGKRVAGNNLRGLFGDVLGYVVKCYRAHGPVFRVRVPGHTITVMAGAEANLFFQRHGRYLFRSVDPYDGLHQAFDAHRWLVNMDGKEHGRLRRTLADGYSSAALGRSMGRAMEIASLAADRWPEDKAIPALEVFRRVVTDQIGVSTTGLSSEGYYDDLFAYLDRVIAVNLLRKMPRFMMKTPRVRRARRQIARLHEEILARHRPQDREGEPRNLTDDILALHREDPQFMPESDLKAAVVGPYFAGMHTASNMGSFMFYEVLKNPDLAERIRAEADALFSLPAEDVPRKLKSLDVTNRTMLETLRLHSVVPAVARTVVNTFEFAGYRIPARSTLLMAFPATHRLEEYFPEPLKFDVDRFTPERNEHRAALGIYNPFGLGVHRCLGATFAEAQTIMTICMLLHRARFVMDPPSYELEVDYSLTPAPHRKFRVRVSGRRKGSHA